MSNPDKTPEPEDNEPLEAGATDGVDDDDEYGTIDCYDTIDATQLEETVELPQPENEASSEPAEKSDPFETWEE